MRRPAPTPHAAWDYVRDLAAVSFVDVLFAAGAVGRRDARRCGSPAIGRASRRRSTVAVVAFAAMSCLYALASVFFFNVFGGFLTYPLLALVGDVHMLRSSVAAQVSRVDADRARRRCRCCTSRSSSARSD